MVKKVRRKLCCRTDYPTVPGKGSIDAKPLPMTAPLLSMEAHVLRLYIHEGRLNQSLDLAALWLKPVANLGACLTSPHRET
jgi:hypothetical protein